MVFFEHPTISIIDNINGPEVMSGCFCMDRFNYNASGMLWDWQIWWFFRLFERFPCVQGCLQSSLLGCLPSNIKVQQGTSGDSLEQWTTLYLSKEWKGVVQTLKRAVTS